MKEIKIPEQKDYTGYFRECLKQMQEKTYTYTSKELRELYGYAIQSSAENKTISEVKEIQAYLLGQLASYDIVIARFAQTCPERIQNPIQEKIFQEYYNEFFEIITLMQSVILLFEERINVRNYAAKQAALRWMELQELSVAIHDIDNTYSMNVQNYEECMNLYSDLKYPFTLETLKKKRNELIKKYHPDNGGTPEIMIRITKTFDILKNLITEPEKTAYKEKEKTDEAETEKTER